MRRVNICPEDYGNCVQHGVTFFGIIVKEERDATSWVHRVEGSLIDYKGRQCLLIYIYYLYRIRFMSFMFDFLREWNPN